MKACPFCAEDIQDTAIGCKHCGRDLVGPPAPATPAVTRRRWPYVLAGLLVLVVSWIGYGSVREKQALAAANGPTFHDTIKDLPEAARFTRLRYVITETSPCDRIVRAVSHEPPSGGVVWSVSCFDGQQYAVVVSPDARRAPIAVSCDMLARTTTTTCWD